MAYSLADSQVPRTGIGENGDVPNKQIVHFVTSIQSQLFWEITKLKWDTDFSKTRFCYPWDISRDFLQVHEEKRKLFSDQFESALYVAAWVIEFEEMFDNPPAFTETNDSIEEYLSEHVEAFNNFDTETELGIYDFNNYLSEDKPTNFHEYFLIALKEANNRNTWENSNFIKEYKANFLSINKV